MGRGHLVDLGRQAQPAPHRLAGGRVADVEGHVAAAAALAAALALHARAAAARVGPHCPPTNPHPQRVTEVSLSAFAHSTGRLMAYQYNIYIIYIYSYYCLYYIYVYIVNIVCTVTIVHLQW